MSRSPERSVGGSAVIYTKLVIARAKPVAIFIVIDTSALVAVIAGEPERNRIVELAAGNRLIGPGSIPWEVGNAFSAMLKQNRITLKEAYQGLAIFHDIPIRYVRVDYAQVLTIAHRTDTYAYDAYFMDCAIRHSAPLMTLDRKLLTAAKVLEIKILEV
jgi:predicted nucleic acid-binding protein